MSSDHLPNYPFCLPSYVAAFDDGQLAEQELKAEARSWRSEGYADDSNVQIYEHHNGKGTTRSYNDAGIDMLLVKMRCVSISNTPIDRKARTNLRPKFVSSCYCRQYMNV
jgi:hypothetical protein